MIAFCIEKAKDEVGLGIYYVGNQQIFFLETKGKECFACLSGVMASESEA